MSRNDPKANAETMNLGAALEIAELIVEARSSIPILLCVRLSASGLVEATDLDSAVAIHTNLGALGAPADGIAVVHREMAEAIKNTDGSVRFGGNAEGRFVSVGDSPTVRLRPQKGDWPSMNPLEDVVAFELVASELATDLSDVSPAMSTEETRYYLNGMLWHVAEERLRFAATDGHRLHRVSRPLPSKLTELKDSIVPRRAIKALRKILDMQPGVSTVRAEFARSKARFTIGAVVLTVRLIDGTFPDYKRVIPSAPKCGIKVSAAELARAATLASRLMGKDSTLFVLNMKDKTVRAKKAGGIEISGSIAADLVGEPVGDVGFRHEYLASVLAPFADSAVTMLLDDAASPCLIEDPDDPRMLAVLMPMRV